jgi:hypothetical protein
MSPFTSKGQALLESVIAFGLLVGLMTTSGALIYAQAKRTNKERIEFENSHREMIRRRTLSENLRYP